MSLATDDQGYLISQARYTPYGLVRWNGGTVMPTKFAFTGQRADGFGLMDYNARFYSPRLARFVSADSMVANLGSAKRLDRYSYTRNNPLRYVDPTGHLDGVPWWEQGQDTSEVTIWIPIASMQVNLSRSLQQNVKAADEITVDGQFHGNLCGQVALAMIYETITGIPPSIYDIARNDNINRDELTGTGDLYNIFDSLISGSTFTAYSGKTKTTFSPNSLPDEENRSTDWVTKTTVMDFIADELSNGNYVILGVYLDQINGELGTIVGSDLDGPNIDGVVGHWLVVTAVYGNFVYVNDPYCNCVRRVDRSVIENAMENFGQVLVITPPPRPQNQQTTNNGYGYD